MSAVLSVGVIGAGIAGLACAQTLRDCGVRVVVFEKSRGVGGRCATRRIDSTTGVDHGAQYFTVRDARFQAAVDQWCAAGDASLWSGRIVGLKRGVVTELAEPHDRFVGVPGMSAIAKHLAAGLDVRTNVAAQAIRRVDAEWHVADATGTLHGPFAALIVSAPPPQTLTLLGGYSSAMSEHLENVRMAPCWAVMLQLNDALQAPFDAAFVDESPLAWIARNDSKPQRQQTNCWTLHATAEWSCRHLEQSADEATQALVQAFWQATTHAPQQPEFVAGHRWRYALPIDPLPNRYLLDSHLRLAACGDWCGGPRIEGAFISGVAAANALVNAG